MPYLTIGGVAVAVAADSGEAAPRVIGTRERAIDGTLVEDRTAVKWEISAESPPLAPAAGLALANLLLDATPSAPLAVAGDLAPGAISCVGEVRGIRKLTVGAGVRRWVISFSLTQV
jgi:hypothetical protein